MASKKDLFNIESSFRLFAAVAQLAEQSSTNHRVSVFWPHVEVSLDKALKPQVTT